MSDDREPIGRKKHNTKKKTRPKSDQLPGNNHENDHNELISSNLSNDRKSPEDRDNRMAARKKKVSKRRRFLIFLLKVAIIFAVVIIFYGIYLDSVIRDRIDGKVWNLPAAVYGQVFTLEPGMQYSKKDIVVLLKGTQYREVTHIIRPGEFTVDKDTIDLLRRPFDFPDGAEGAIQARIYFDHDQIARIENLANHRNFGFFRLDPRLITMMQSTDGEQRLYVARSGFPTTLVDTLIATEDRHFYEHDGISLQSILRALIANIAAGRTVQGGSTLTQQLVKNLFLTNKRSLWRKINEAYMAIIMDNRYSKDRILELYMNEVYLGQNGNDQIRGFPLASLYYFGRPVDELSIDQQAMLVGMVKGASLYNPWRNPKLTLERRNLVLKLLEEQNYIDASTYNTLINRPLGVQPKGGVITPQPDFMQIVRNELREKLGNKASHLSGAKIFTTLDPVSQDAAEKAVSEGIVALKTQRRLPDLEGAMVVVDRFTGEIRAVVGGAETQYAGFNRATQAYRSVGSLAKPATYLTALNQPGKYRLNTWLMDAPISISIPGSKTWEPKNYDRQYRGQVMLIDALAHSLNVPTVNLGMTLGIPRVTTMLERLGIPKSEIDPVPAILLGAINLTPMEVAQEFQTIASGGTRAKLSALRAVIGEDGKPLYQSLPQSQREVSQQAAYLTLYAMQQVVNTGTSRALLSKFPNYHLAGKTGTTNNLIDSWFAGIDGHEVAITWVGRDNNETSKLTGSSGALTVYRRYLENSIPQPLVLEKPINISSMYVDQSGNFVCSDDVSTGDVGSLLRVLPVWTSDPSQLCHVPQPQTPVSYQGLLDAKSDSNQSTAPTSNGGQQQQSDNNEAPGWLRELFGQ